MILFAVCVLFLAMSTGRLIEEIETAENLRLRDAREEPFAKAPLLVVMHCFGTYCRYSDATLATKPYSNQNSRFQALNPLVRTPYVTLAGAVERAEISVKSKKGRFRKRLRTPGTSYRNVLESG